MHLVIYDVHCDCLRLMYSLGDQIKDKVAYTIQPDTNKTVALFGLLEVFKKYTN
jgi:hypothetical protein